jgi:hypothetical protein
LWAVRVQALGGSGKRTKIGNRDKCAQLIEIKGAHGGFRNSFLPLKISFYAFIGHDIQLYQSFYVGDDSIKS